MGYEADLAGGLDQAQGEYGSSPRVVLRQQAFAVPTSQSSAFCDYVQHSLYQHSSISVSWVVPG